MFVTTSVLAPGVTVVEAKAALLAGSGSDVVPVTPAVARRVPPERGSTSIANAETAPMASVPSWQVTRFPTTLQLAGDPPIATNSALGPNAKSSCTPVAGFGPVVRHLDVVGEGAALSHGVGRAGEGDRELRRRLIARVEKHEELALGRVSDRQRQIGPPVAVEICDEDLPDLRRG